MNIGLTIKNMRTEQAITQRGLSIETGLSQAYIAMIENNVRKPSISSIENICKAFDISIARFFISILTIEDFENQGEIYLLSDTIENLVKK